MKRIPLLVTVLLGFAPPGPSGRADELETAKKRFEDSIATVTSAAGDRADVLHGQYLSALSNLYERVQGEGNLDAVLEVRTEAERFTREKKVAPEAAAKSFPGLGGLQRQYIEKAAALEKAQKQEILNIALKYDAQLAALHRTLSLQRRTEMATATLQERERVASTYAPGAQPAPSAGATGHGPATTAARGPSIVYPLAKKLATQSHSVDVRTWTALAGRVVVVDADPRKECDTGLVIGPGETYLLLPCAADRWNTSPARWADVDFRGHHKEAERATNGMPYLQMCYSLDGGPLISLVDNYILDKPGRVLLAPSDREGGGGPDNNTGSIRVKIVRIHK